LPIFDSDPDFEIRIFGGGFYYWADNLQNVAGPRGRVEARIYDLDFLTDGSRLTLGGEVRNDDVRGTEGFGSVIVRIPLAAMGVGSQPKVTGLDRRMLDRIVREPIITGIGYNDEAVFVNNGDARVDSIFFATDGGGGSGIKYDPDSLADALANGGDNSIVVLDDNNGAYTAGPGGIDLAEGQNLVGAGKAVKLTGSYTGYMVYFTPLPGEGTPTIIGDDDSASLITFQNNSSIVNLYLEGDFYHGVHGPDVESNFWIQDLVIDLSSATGDGIRTYVNNPRDNVYNLFTTSTPSGFINWNRIFDSSDRHGILTTITANDGDAHSFDLAVTQNTINNVWYEGIHVEVYVDGAGSSLKNSIDVSWNSIDNVDYNDGIKVHAHADNEGFLDQADPVTINYNSINNVYDDGIETYTDADYGGTILQTLSVNWNTITDTDEGEGMEVRVAARNGGLIDQANTINVNNNSIFDTGGDGIEVDVEVEDSGSTAIQTININNNSISETNGDGISVEIDVRNGGFLDQANTLNINDNSIADIGDEGDDGIDVDVDIYDDATAIQTININGNSIDDIDDDGIEVDTNVNNDSFLDQANTITINNNTITDTGNDGIDVDTYVGYGSTVVQTTNIIGNVIGTPGEDDDIGDKGIEIDNDVRGGGFLDQSNTITIGFNTITATDEEGIEIDNFADYGLGRPGTLLQRINIHHNSVFEIDDEGIEIDTVAVGTGTPPPNNVFIQQHIDIDDNIVSANLYESDGIQVETRAANGAFIDQGSTINIRRNTVTDTGDDGIQVENDVYRATLAQSLNVSGNTVTYSGQFYFSVVSHNVYVNNDVNYNGTLFQTIDVNDNFLSRNSYADFFGLGPIIGDGVNITTDLDRASTATQTINVLRNSISYESDDGVDIDTDVSNDSIMNQANTITVAGNTINHIGYGIIGFLLPHAGVSIDNDADTAGTLAQTVNVTDNVIYDVNDSFIIGLGGEGVRITNNADDLGTTLTQTVDVSRNSISATDDEGVQISTDVNYDAFVDQANTITVSGNTIHDAGSDGVLVDNQVGNIGFIITSDNTGTLLQTVNIDDNTIFDVGGDGIDVNNDVEYAPSLLVQTVNIRRNSVTDTGDDGIVVDNHADEGFIDQENTVTIDDNTVLRADNDGIYVNNEVDDEGTIRQTLNVRRNSVDESGDEGIKIDVDADDEPESRHYQTGTISHNTVVNSDSDGLYIDVNVDDGAFSTQTFDIGHNSIAGNGSEGVRIDIENDDDETSTSFFLDFYNNVIHDNTADGLAIDILIDNDDASNVFNATIRDNSIVNNDDDGIEILINLDQDGVSIADIDFVGNTIGGNGLNVGDDGIYVRVEADDAALSNTMLEFTDNTVFLSYDDGIELRQDWDSADTGGSVTMSAAFMGNDINANGDDGVFLYNSGDTSDLHAFQTVLFTPGGNYITNHDGAGDFGLYASNNDFGIQFVDLTSVTFAGNGTAFGSNGGGFIQTIIGP
ncbi:MAG: right-handed parallel beta-helix repeat-containing protein, partial [Alphaproteobacteria bacterium]|nr:right-handed parallel beta-helix repeat-containing protein [Alphaproteobacteria bacterium]